MPKTQNSFHFKPMSFVRPWSTKSTNLYKDIAYLKPPVFSCLRLVLQSFCLRACVCACLRANVSCERSKKCIHQRRRCVFSTKTYHFLSSEQETAILRVTVRRVEETNRSPIAQASHHESFHLMKNLLSKVTGFNFCQRIICASCQR